MSYGSSDLLPLFPPENVQAAHQVNRSFLFTEHIMQLTWTESSINQDTQLAEYRIYAEVSGDFVEIGRVGAGRFSFFHRSPLQGDTFNYAIRVEI